MAIENLVMVVTNMMVDGANCIKYYKTYELNSNEKVLQINSEKGFLLHDLKSKIKISCLGQKLQNMLKILKNNSQ